MILLLKILMTPLIIAVATLIARRWGENIGGLIIGLPLTSGPVSIFFAIEQGHGFAANAAKGALLGLIPTAVFCTGYVLSARRQPWYVSAFLSISAYLVTVWGISMLTPGLSNIAVIIPLVLCAALWVVGKQQTTSRHIPSPWWELPMRILVATTLLLVITTAVGQLGPKWSGLLSPFPIFTFVMVTFSHSQGGAGAAWRLINGVLTGLFSYTAFFLVVAMLIDRGSLWIVYPLAALTALSINGLSLALLLWKNRAARQRALL